MAGMLWGQDLRCQAVTMSGSNHSSPGHQQMHNEHVLNSSLTPQGMTQSSTYLNIS